MDSSTFPIMPARVRGAHSIYDYFAAVRLNGGFVIVSVPWGLMASHEQQAKRNHSQTLTRLAERGGLTASEAVAVLEDREWTNMPEGEAHRRLAAILHQRMPTEIVSVADVLAEQGRAAPPPPPDRQDHL